MKTKVIRLILFLGLCVSFFLVLPFVFLINGQLAYYSYKEVVYRTIINNVIGKETEPKKISFLLSEYLYRNLFTPYGSAVIDKDVYNDLLRGIAWCDQKAWALGTFLGKLGIDNRMVMTRNPEGVSNHTVLEVFIDKKWRLFDPTYGLSIAKDNNGELASYDDICRDPALFYSNLSVLALKNTDPDKYREVKEYSTRNIFYGNHSAPIVWRNPIKNKGFPRRIITKILDSYFYIFGNNFSYLYQDVYLKFFSPAQKSDYLFFRARNYDLFDRYQLAIDTYKTFINSFPKDAASEKAFFFLGKLYNKIGKLYNKKEELKLSINTFQALLEKYPETKWKRAGIYYLGYGHELLNNYEIAADYYWEGINMYKQLGETGLRPGELKTATRLNDVLDKVSPKKETLLSNRKDELIRSRSRLESP